MEISIERIRAARALAIITDVIQFTPPFWVGFINPIDDLLDIVVGIIMCRLLGPHIAFLPTFFFKELPIAEMAPTWTIAYAIASQKAKRELNR